MGNSEDCRQGVHGMAALVVAKALGTEEENTKAKARLITACQWQYRGRASSRKETLVQSSNKKSVHVLCALVESLATQFQKEWSVSVCQEHSEFLLYA